jgi:hypothetical protein
MKDNQSTIRPFDSIAGVADELEVLDFIKSLPQTFTEAEKILSSTPIGIVDNNVLENRIKLATFIRKFHSQADTLNDDILKQGALLNDPTTKLLVSSHQPNLFAYGGIFKKIVLLETLKSTIENRKKQGIINVFIIIDHDFIDEIWMRRAQLPSFHHSSGILQLRLAINPSKKWQMICNIPRPAETTLYTWKREIISWIKKSTYSQSLRQRMFDNLDRFWEVVEAAYSKARSYSDFNSFLMSKIVNGMWGYSTLFVRLTEISPVFTNGFEFLLSNLYTYTDILAKTEHALLSRGISTRVSTRSYNKAPIWLHCKCGSKASVSLSTEGKLSFKGSCISCKKELSLDLHDPLNPDISKDISYMSPRAIAIPLLLSRDLQISCYCSGKGGLGYLMDANMISKHLGVRRPLTLVCGSKDVYNGIAQNQALNAIHMGVPEAKRRLQELDLKNSEYRSKIYDLVIKRAELAHANRSLSGLLEELFQLKQEQRRIRREMDIIEKATRILSLSPCILDYALNFGMVDTGKQWCRHLLVNGSLFSPIYFG